MQKNKKNMKNRNKKTKSKNNKNIVANVAVTRQIVTKEPTFTQRSRGCTIRHREFVDNVAGASAFGVTYYDINPGNPDLFPWLSQIATCYESYKIVNLTVVFETTSATSETGSVMLAFDYDTEDNSPISKAEMLSYYGVVRTAPWSRATMSFDKTNLTSKTYFTRSHAQPLDSPKLYDIGTILCATEGITGNIVGELWVDYEFELIHPQRGALDDPGFRLSVPSVSGGLATPLQNAQEDGLLGITRKEDDTFEISFDKAGQYLVVTYCGGTGFSDPLVNTYGTATRYNISEIYSTTNVHRVESVITKLPNQTFGFILTGHAASVTRIDMWIVPFNSATARLLGVNPD